VTGTVWLNGGLVPAAEARVSVFDHGFLYGDGLFETVRAYGGRLFMTDAHFDRLASGARRVGLDVPFDRAGFADLLDRTRRANGLEEALLRLTVSRGAGPPVPDASACGPATVVVTARPAATRDPDRWRRGIAVALVPGAVAAGGLKSISYQAHVLALAEARRRGADEAVLVNPAGEVAEGSVSNLFGVWGGLLATPPLDAGALAGVTRAVVLELAEREGVPAAQRTLSPEDLGAADELFVTGSGWEVMPVTRLDGHEVGEGSAGPVTARLHAAFRRTVDAVCGAARSAQGG
jgi:branched-chain amino acid aminotransferase